MSGMHPGLATRPTEHVVAFYHSDDFVVEEVACFISAGLAANEHVIALATTRHRNAITARLDQSGSLTAVRPAPDSWSSSRQTRHSTRLPWTAKLASNQFRAMLAPLVKPGVKNSNYGELSRCSRNAETLTQRSQLSVSAMNSPIRRTFGFCAIPCGWCAAADGR